jgi:hypothetical protein
VRLDHLLSKEIPEPDEVRINMAVYRILVVSFERVTVPQKVKISVAAYTDYFSGTPETIFHYVKSSVWWRWRRGTTRSHTEHDR